MIRDGADDHGVLDRAWALLDEQYRISHATFQVEPESHDGCQHVTW